MTFRTVIPEPPSVNAMWRSINGRTILSRVGRQYKIDAGAALIGAPSLGAGPFRVTIELPAKSRKDVDNQIKPVLDALQSAGVIENDRYVRDVRAFKGAGSETIVTVELLNVEHAD